MPQSLSNILIHLVFSTKNRLPLIQPPLADELWRYLANASAACECPAHRIGGTADHVHIVCGLARTMAVSDLLGEIKKSSSKWMKRKGVPGFAWQSGYGVFSIGQSQLGRVVSYICRQEEHHRRRTFQEEFRVFCRKYGVEIDERYVWD